MTYLGLILSMLAILLAFEGHFHWSFIALIWSGICDFLDGVIARKVKQSSDSQKFGLHIDTIVDMASFVLTPVVIAATIGMTESLFGQIIFVFYVWAGASRLAFFNVHGLSDSGKTQFYVGLPVTYSAIILPLSYVISEIINVNFINETVTVTIFLTGLAFIAKIPIPKAKGIFLFIFPLLAIISTIYLLII